MPITQPNGMRCTSNMYIFLVSAASEMGVSHAQDVKCVSDVALMSVASVCCVVHCLFVNMRPRAPRTVLHAAHHRLPPHEHTMQCTQQRLRISALGHATRTVSPRPVSTPRSRCCCARSSSSSLMKLDAFLLSFRVSQLLLCACSKLAFEHSRVCSRSCLKYTVLYTKIHNVLYMHHVLCFCTQCRRKRRALDARIPCAERQIKYVLASRNANAT